MGGRTPSSQKETLGNISIGRTTHQTTCRRPADRRQKTQVAECVTADLIKIAQRHFSPDFEGARQNSDQIQFRLMAAARLSPFFVAKISRNNLKCAASLAIVEI